MLKDFLLYLEHLVDLIGPTGIAIATFIESLIAPIPSEVVLVFTGTALYSTNEILIYALAATAGSYLGTLPFYLIAYKSKALIYSMVNKFGRYFFIDTDDIDKAEEKFRQHGRIAVLTGRLIPGIRSLISIPAGISKMNIIQYSVYTLSGSFCWNILLISAGYFFKDQYKIFLNYLDIYEKSVYALLILIILVTYYLLYRRKAHSK